MSHPANNLPSWLPMWVQTLDVDKSSIRNAARGEDIPKALARSKRFDA